MRLEVSQCWNICSLTRPEKKREAHCEWAHFEHHLMVSAALLALCLEQWEMFGSSAAWFSTCSSVWSKWVNSWDLTILETIAYWSSFLWQTLCCNLTEWCFAIFLSVPFCLMKRTLKFNQRVFIISSNSFYTKKHIIIFPNFRGRPDK